MSVAFRRESDEEHKEPRFELPLPPGANPVTGRGLAMIDARVSELEAAIAAERDAAAVETLRRDLRYWHTRQTTAQIAPAPAGDVAAFGSRVRFRLNGAERTIDIVGHDEGEPAAGRVPFAAPLAQALIGAGVGDFADFGGVVEAIEVLAVGPID